MLTTRLNALLAGRTDFSYLLKSFDEGEFFLTYKSLYRNILI